MITVTGLRTPERDDFIIKIEIPGIVFLDHSPKDPDIIIAAVTMFINDFLRKDPSYKPGLLVRVYDWFAGFLTEGL